MKPKGYKDLIVWQRAMELVKEIYLITAQLPADERFALTSQMRRAVISIPSSIAEGYMRKHRKEYLYFLSVSFGSTGELETQILVIDMLFPHISTAKAASLANEVGKMLNSMISKLEGGGTIKVARP